MGQEQIETIQQPNQDGWGPEHANADTQPTDLPSIETSLDSQVGLVQEIILLAIEEVFENPKKYEGGGGQGIEESVRALAEDESGLDIEALIVEAKKAYRSVLTKVGPAVEKVLESRRKGTLQAMIKDGNTAKWFVRGIILPESNPNLVTAVLAIIEPMIENLPEDEEHEKPEVMTLYRKDGAALLSSNPTVRALQEKAMKTELPYLIGESAKDASSKLAKQLVGRKEILHEDRKLIAETVYDRLERTNRKFSDIIHKVIARNVSPDLAHTFIASQVKHILLEDNWDYKEGTIKLIAEALVKWCKKRKTTKEKPKRKGKGRKRRGR